MTAEGTVRDQVDAKKAEIEAGTWDVFHGPFNKQDGTEWVAAGASLSDGEMLGMIGFVEGIDGEIPTCCNLCGPSVPACP
ncbi:MAG: hypothetical protein P1V51_09905 [Deltaproteobacteria bacterium]|nr:hypothetical protein [Deltaproteobacteria bacterium]